MDSLSHRNIATKERITLSLLVNIHNIVGFEHSQGNQTTPLITTELMKLSLGFTALKVPFVINLIYTRQLCNGPTRPLGHRRRSQNRVHYSTLEIWLDLDLTLHLQKCPRGISFLGGWGWSGWQTVAKLTPQSTFKWKGVRLLKYSFHDDFWKSNWVVTSESYYWNVLN